jgi:rhamnose transport system permease protein
MRSRRDLGLAALTALLFAVAAVSFPGFASIAGVRSLADDSAILLLLAIGEALVILTRAIDLSIAANVAFSGMIVALLNRADPGLSLAVLIPLAVLVGAALGAVNGLAVWLLRVPSIVVTLGTMAIYRGCVYLLSHGTWVTSAQMSAAFQGFVRLRLLGFTLLSWLALLGVLKAWLLLRYTTTGRRFFVAGNNPQAAVYAGVDVGHTQFLAFVLSGAIAGLCGYLWVARYAVAYTDVANGFELQVIAACVIGGISIGGGVGTVSGVVLGCLFLGILKNALPLLGVSPFWQTAVSGLVITIAVIINARDASAGRRRILESHPS